MIKRILTVLLLSCVFPLMLFQLPCYAIAIPVDLTVFYSDGTVSFGPEINDAILEEDEGGLTYLSNDPFFFSDPGVYVPSDATTLSLNLQLFTTGVDSFEFLVFGTPSGSIVYEWFIDGTFAPSKTYDLEVDLIALGLVDTTIGMEFTLSYNLDEDTTIDATFALSNVNINLAVPVPEPASVLLLACGMAVFGIWGRKKFRRII